MPKDKKAAGRTERITVQCSCGKRLLSPRKMAGKRVKCPACGGLVSVPAKPAAVPEQSSPPLSPTPQEPVSTGGNRILVALWSLVGVVGLASVVFIAWHYSSSQPSRDSTPHVAQKDSVAEQVDAEESLPPEETVVAKEPPHSGDGSGEHVVDAEDNVSASGEAAQATGDPGDTRDSAAALELERAEQDRIEQGNRETSELFEKAKQSIQGDRVEEAIALLRQYLDSPYSTKKAEAQTLLDEAQRRQSAFKGEATVQEATIAYLKKLRQINTEFASSYQDLAYSPDPSSRHFNAYYNIGSCRLAKANGGRAEKIAVEPKRGVDQRLTALVEEALLQSTAFVAYASVIYDFETNKLTPTGFLTMDKETYRKLLVDRVHGELGTPEQQQDATLNHLLAAVKTRAFLNWLGEYRTKLLAYHAELEEGWVALLDELRDDYFPGVSDEALVTLAEAASPLPYTQNPVTKFVNIGEGTTEKDAFTLGRIRSSKLIRIAHAKVSWHCFVRVPGSSRNRIMVRFEQVDAPVAIREVGEKTASFCHPGQNFLSKVTPPTIFEVMHVYKPGCEGQDTGSGLTVWGRIVEKVNKVVLGGKAPPPIKIPDKDMKIFRLTFPEGATVETNEPTDEIAMQRLKGEVQPPGQ